MESHLGYVLWPHQADDALYHADPRFRHFGYGVLSRTVRDMEGGDQILVEETATVCSK